MEIKTQYNTNRENSMIIVISEGQKDRKRFVDLPLNSKKGCKHVLNTKQSKATDVKDYIVGGIEIANLHGW